MWISYPSLRECIASSWTAPIANVSPWQIVGAKLKRLRFALRHWNKHVFGRLEVNIEKAYSDLQLNQNDISVNGFSNVRHKKELDAHAALTLSLNQQEIFLKEKCRNKWLAAGDRNSAFFN